jgi:hypothetical protein
MDDRGFVLTWQAVSEQLAAMPSELYLVRLIHARSLCAFQVNASGAPGSW